MNQALITQLRILKLSNSKPNFSELARMYGVDRRTVKKYYDGYQGKPEHRYKPSKLDKHEELIKSKLAIKGTTIRAVYEFILTEVDSQIGTYSNFNKYVKSKAIKPKKASKAIRDMKQLRDFRHRLTGKKTYPSPTSTAKSSPFRCLITNWAILDTATLPTNYTRQDRMYSTV